MKKMTKPKPITRTSLDYNECADYIDKKYKIKQRDYLGKFAYYDTAKKETIKKFKDDSWYNIIPADMNEQQKAASDYYDDLLKKHQPKYLDFWHWVVDNYEIHNGCYITFSRETYDAIKEDWVKTIYGYYLTEFENKNGEIDFRVEW